MSRIRHSNLLRTVAVCATAAATYIASPSSAEAASTLECVGFDTPASDCTNSHPAANLQAVMNAVQSDGDVDVIRLAPVQFVGEFDFGTADGDNLEGSGRTQTLIRSESTGNQPALKVSGLGATQPTVRDLSIERALGTSLAYALQIINGKLERVDIENVNLTVGGTALWARKAFVDDANVVANGPDVRAVYVQADPVIIEDSTISSAGTGASASWGGVHLGGSTVTLRRSVIGGLDGNNSFAISVTGDSGNVVLEDSLVHMGSGSSRTGVQAQNSNAGTWPLGLKLVRSTILGSGSFQKAVNVQSDNAGEVLSWEIDSSVISLTGLNSTDIRCRLVAPGSIALAQITNTAFRGNVFDASADCAETQTGTVNITGIAQTALFKDPTAFNWQPALGGLLLDGGDPASAGSGGDVRGLNRLADGDGVGNAVIDLGAYEYQRAYPTADAAASKKSLQPGEATTFSASAQDLIDGESVTITGWAFGDGTTSTDSSPTHAYGQDGVYTATVTVEDSTGLTSTDTVDVTVTTPPPPPAPPAATGTATPTGSATASAASDELAPALSLIRAQRASLRTGKALRVAARTARTVKLTLNEQATVKITIAKKSGTRFVALRGQQKLTLAAGTRHIAWGGRWAGATQKAGTYRLTFTATDAAGNRSVKKVIVTLV
jgi:hypothetical protein